MLSVLVTGVTGFVGAEIASKLLENGIRVIGLKRRNSNTWRCSEIEKYIHWIDIAEGYEDVVIQHKPDIIIHAAWIGVESGDRDDWQIQSENIPFLLSLLDIAKQISCKKFIFLGSQAEYGILNSKVSEDYPASAITAYGGVKLACLEIVKAYAELNNLPWIWLRIFSLFGEKENHTWLIPSLINKIRSESQMDFTPGKQQYAYLYLPDFATIMLKIVNTALTSGIYNVSSNVARPLKSVIITVRDLVRPTFKLNFGAIPYRSGQSMHIEGDISKLTASIGEINFTNFDLALETTINSYLLNAKAI